MTTPRDTKKRFFSRRSCLSVGILVLSAVIAYVWLGPGNLASSGREKIHPGMSLTEAMQSAGGWAFCKGYQEKDGNRVNQITASRKGRDISMDTGVIKNAGSPAGVPAIIEAEMKKRPGTWKLDFAYLNAAGPRTYFTVTFDKDLHVSDVSALRSGRLD